jgi:energy-coupling factor transporter ATP-binding protein EcfA2
MEQKSFSVSIPENLVTERVNELVAYKLRHEKLMDMLQKALVDYMGKELVTIRSGVTDLLLGKLNVDLRTQRDGIITSFLESKRTEIFLNRELKGVITDPTAHNELPKLLSFLQLFSQALIVGPTGSGKSTMAKQAADALKLPYASFSCNQEASKSELVGFANITGYVESNFLQFYENGGVFLIDEYDAMSPSIAVVLNAAFDRSGQIAVPNRSDKPVAFKHPEFYCILAGNTWGSGSIEYQGREMQDMAFLDRFKLCRIEIGYDSNVEQHIARDHYDWFMRIRRWMNDHVEAEKFSTRSIYDATVLLNNGFSKKDIIHMTSQHWEESLRDNIISTVGV